jgi:uncharacterized membrane protein YciS (DUF1049 family)
METLGLGVLFGAGLVAGVLIIGGLCLHASSLARSERKRRWGITSLSLAGVCWCLLVLLYALILS